MRLIVLLFVTLCAVVQGQWVNHRWQGVPRNKDGTVDLSAKAPRSSNGKPDLSGVWHVQATTMQEWRRIAGPDVGITGTLGMGQDTISKYATNLFVDLKPEEVPERPEAATIRKARLASGIRDNPSSRCLPHGIPLASLLTEVFKMVQTPGLIVAMYEADNTFRQIYLDSRKVPADAEPTWLGYSAGHWEGDTLVVETSGFNDKSWLDLAGHSHSEGLHVTERYRRRDFGHMEMEVTIDDPKMYTRPIKLNVTQVLQPDTDVFEFFCNENEKDRSHLVAK